jgi:hypothetical protein
MVGYPRLVSLYKERYLFVQNSAFCAGSATSLFSLVVCIFGCTVMKMIDPRIVRGILIE